MDKNKILELINKMQNNKINDIESKELSKLAGLNPFYIKNPSSWKIQENILRKLFFVVYPELNSLPDNWLKMLNV